MQEDGVPEIDRECGSDGVSRMETVSGATELMFPLLSLIPSGFIYAVVSRTF